MTSLPPKFLLVDDNADSRLLLAHTLERKFPGFVRLECGNAPEALAAVKLQELTAIIVHRAAGMDGASMVRAFRQLNPTVPVVMVSGSDRSAEAYAAGADAFLHYDEWLRIGMVVKSLLDRPAPQSAPPFGSR